MSERSLTSPSKDAVASNPISETGSRLVREAELLGRGIVGGAIKQAEKDPLGTAGEAVGAVGIGAVLGACSVAASPVVAASAVGLGLLGTGTWLWNTFNTYDPHNRERNAAVAKAMAETWNSDSQKAFDKNVGVLEAKLGKDSLDLGLGLLSGAGAGAGYKFIPGALCRTQPAIGFRFFSQHAVERAFPAQVREFQLVSKEKPFWWLKENGPAQVRVQELLGKGKDGQSKLGPEKLMLIAHSTAESTPGAAQIGQSDLVATCHPERLAPELRGKSVLQKAQDVHMQVDYGSNKLRFLTDDYSRQFPLRHDFRVHDWFRLGKFIEGLDANAGSVVAEAERNVDLVPKLGSLDDIARRDFLKSFEKTFAELEDALRGGDNKTVDQKINKLKLLNKAVECYKEGADVGALRPGIHKYSMSKLKEDFAYNEQRQAVFGRLQQVVQQLQEAGCRRLWIGGSFVTGKEAPKDFDLTWDPTHVDRKKVDPSFLQFSQKGRKEKYGGDIFQWIPEVTGYDHVQGFQKDRLSESKGIVLIDLTKEP